VEWSKKRVRSQVFTLAGHSGEVYSVAFSPDGKYVVSGSGDKLVKIWDAKTGAEVSSCLGVRCGGCFLWGFAHTSNWEGSEERVCWQVCTLTGHSKSVLSVAFSADGQHVVSGSEDKLVMIWHTDPGIEVISVIGVRSPWCATQRAASFFSARNGPKVRCLS